MSPGALEGEPPSELAGRCGRCGAVHSVPNDAALGRAALTALFEQVNNDVAEAAVRGDLDGSAGKMVGVAVVADATGARSVLRAFSGDLGGREEQSGWAPALVRRADTAALQAETWALVNDVDARLAAGIDDDVRRSLTAGRREASRRLMAAMHDAVVLVNRAGHDASLREVFTSARIPSGTADCAVPKLLVDANRRGLSVLGVAEAWWGPPHGTRRHGRIEPPCAERCAPLLGFLLCDT